MCEHWCELMLQWWMYCTHAYPFPLELIYNCIVDQHPPLLIKGLFSKIVLHAWFWNVLKEPLFLDFMGALLFILN